MNKEFRYKIHPLFKLMFLILVSILGFYQWSENNYLYRSIISLSELILFIIITKNWKEIRNVIAFLLINTLSASVFLLIFGTSFESTINFSFDYLLTTTILFFGALIYWKTTPNNEILDFFKRLHIPNAISIGLTIALSFIPVFFKAVRETIVFQKSRGFRFRTLNISAILIPILIKMFTLSNNLAISLESRGFEL